MQFPFRRIPTLAAIAALELVMGAVACTPPAAPVGGSGGAPATGGVGAPGTGGAGSGGAAAPGSGGTPASGGASPPADGGTGGAPALPDGGADRPPDGPARDVAMDRAPATDATGPLDGDGGGGGLAGWTLVWSDEFDVDGAPQPSNWRYETGFVRNMELQWYQMPNATVSGGVLTIEGKRETVANPSYQAGSSDWKRSRQNAQYTSSSITTSGKHTFTYGRFETRARIDVRQGSWPAFWTVGAMGGWPAGGEIDIMEFYAGKVLANVCKPNGSTCAWSSVTKNVSALGADWPNQFHVWAMEWDATKIDLFLDGTLMNHFLVADAVPAGTTNPYVARPVYIIVNLALGGTNGGDPSNTTFPIKYEVDYVRVYQRP
jgi:beta-glucanase (GH16 family)